MHPALLLNQILAINIVRNFSIIQKACETYQYSFFLLENLIHSLKIKCQDALKKLAQDVENMALIMEQQDNRKKQRWHITTETLIACESVCNLISYLEVSLSRIQSLMQKINDTDLTHKIMTSEKGKHVIAHQLHIDFDFLKQPFIQEF